MTRVDCRPIQILYLSNTLTVARHGRLRTTNWLVDRKQRLN